MNCRMLFLGLLFLPGLCFAWKPVKVSEDIQVTKVSDRVYVYVAMAQIGEWGMVPCNGVILVEEGKAFLLDSPMNDEQTQTLVEWMSGTLKAEVTGFIPNHWHGDCLGGLRYLHRKGVKSYANEMTIRLAKEHGAPVPQVGFRDSLYLSLGQLEVRCYYLGGGHSEDNIVVWVPSEKLLWGGCLLKDTSATNLGNLEDAVPEVWPETVRRVMAKFPEAEVVVPGHGNFGGMEIPEHTLKLLSGR